MFEPVLFTRCGSNFEITSPVKGAASITGTAVYASGKFGNGWQGATGTRINTNPTALFTNNEKGCIEFWWKPTTGYNAADNFMFLIWSGTTGGGAGSAMLRIYVAGGGTGINFAVANHGGTVILNATVLWATINAALGYSITAGSWYHLVLTWNQTDLIGSTDRARAYIDGVIVTSAVGSTSIQTFGSASNCGFGDISGAGGAPLIGIMDNIKVFDYAKIDFSDRFNERGGLHDQVS